MSTLYTVKQVARLLDVTPMTVYRLVREEDLPYVRVGSQLRFTAVALRKRLDLGPKDEIVIPPRQKPLPRAKRRRKAVKA